MEFDRQPGVAIWQQIAQSLEDDIQKGVYPPGSQFPTELELVDRFGVHRHTVRRTISELTRRGLLRVERGHGTFVEDVLINYPVSKKTSFTANLIQQQKEPGHTIVDRKETAPAPEIAQMLGIEKSDMVYVLETVGEADGIPISVSTNYFPVNRFPDLLDHYQKKLSITKVMEHYGLRDISRKQTRVTTELPNTADAKLLRVAKTRPILVAQSIDVDSEGKPVSCNRVRFVGDRVQLLFEFDRHDAHM